MSCRKNGWHAELQAVSNPRIVLSNRKVETLSTTVSQSARGSYDDSHQRLRHSGYESSSSGKEEPEPHIGRYWKQKAVTARLSSSVTHPILFFMLLSMTPQLPNFLFIENRTDLEVLVHSVPGT